MEKKILPADVYDKILVYIALETSKQALAMVPEYVRNGLEHYETVISSYAEEVNEKLYELHKELMDSSQDEYIKSCVVNLLDRDMLGVERITILKSLYDKAN